MHSQLLAVVFKCGGIDAHVEGPLFKIAWRSIGTGFVHGRIRVRVSASVEEFNPLGHDVRLVLWHFGLPLGGLTELSLPCWLKEGPGAQPPVRDVELNGIYLTTINQRGAVNRSNGWQRSNPAFHLEHRTLSWNGHGKDFRTVKYT